MFAASHAALLRQLAKSTKSLPEKSTAPLVPLDEPSPAINPSTLHTFRRQTLRLETTTTNSRSLSPEVNPDELDSNVMVTRTFVVDDEDLEAPEAALRALIENDYEADEERVDRRTVPSKARGILGMQAPVHPALGAGW